MSQVSVIYACLMLSGGLLATMYRRSRGRSLLFYLAAFFALFAYGPVVNYVLGNTIYFGTQVRYIGEACVGFTLALAGLATADVLVGQRADCPHDPNPDPSRLYQFFPPVLVALIVYGAVMTARLTQSGAAANKLVLIGLAGPGHRIFLLIEICAVSTYFLSTRTRLLRCLWSLNAVVYVAYCLVSAERDFIFVLFSVFLHRQILVSGRGLSRSVVVVGLGSIIAASLLFARRAGEALDLAGVLNQGSLLFVDTFVIGWVPRHVDYAYGETYVQAIATLPPSWIHRSDIPSLSEWLVSLYAPGSSGGYGFSLSAEAYLNFGLVGIYPVFLLLGLTQRAIVNRFGRSEWCTFFSVFMLAAVLYAIRGDSSQLIKLMIYGAVFFAAIYMTSSRSARGVECSTLGRLERT